MPQERRNSDYREAGRRSRSSSPAPRRRRSAARSASFAVLYAVAVIGVSALLACVGWIAASDVLALNKEEHSVTVTITPEDSYDDVVDMLKDNGLIEYKSLFKLFSAITGGKDKIASSGTFTLNSDMDYRALISGISANSASRAVVDVTIPEGYTVAQIFQLLEEKGVATVEELQEAAANHDYAFSFLQDIPLGDYHRLEGYLFKDAVKNQVYVTKKPQPGAKTAVTEYRTLCSARGLSLVECRLLTGRTHQIRAQMAAAGCPLLGDGKYGRERINRTYGETGQMLYSYKLTFTLPTDAGRLEYLRGRTFQVQRVPFAEKYFPDFKLS